MRIYDKSYIQLYNGDVVIRNGNKYDVTILDNGINLSNDMEELFLDCNNNDVFEDIEVYVDMDSIECDKGLFGA